MSAAENRAAVLAFYNAATTDPEGAIQMVLELMAPDVAVHESPLVPWGGDYVGVEAFFVAFSRIAAHIEVAGWEVGTVLADGEWVASRCWAPYRATPDSAPVRVMISEWFHFHDGRIIEIWPLFFDVPAP